MWCANLKEVGFSKWYVFTLLTSQICYVALIFCSELPIDSIQINAQCLKIPNKVLLHVKIMFIVKCCWLWFMAVQTGTQHISFFVTSAYYHWSWSSTQGHWCLLGDRKGDGPYYYHLKILRKNTHTPSPSEEHD